MRLDIYISQKHSLSRNKASEYIKKGFVTVNKQTITKSSFKVKTDDVYFDKPYMFVARSGQKLYDFIKEADIKNTNCLDIGSSTGGFTQCLLRKNAKTVTAVDVGSDQLHESLRKDKRVQLFEKTDIRTFKTKEQFDIITCDVSFISIFSILDVIQSLASLNTEIYLLFKPQFEIKAEKDKKGVLKLNDLEMNLFLKEAFARIEKTFQILKWEKASVKGANGNQEFILHLKTKNND